ncbi:MAG: WD40-repeat-containing domain protein [Podila humilis]|nr:MAG: WD40-repeat-containing domain protein [Podila humilis]
MQGGGNEQSQEHPTWSASEPAKKRTYPQSNMSRSKPVNLLSRLPTELAFVILYQIPYRSLVAMTRVDRYWRELILQHDNNFWYRLCQKHGYLPSDPALYSGHASGGHKVSIQLGEAVQMRPGLTRALEQSSKNLETRTTSSSSSPNHGARIDKRIDTWCRLFEISTILEAEWKVGKPTIKELRGHQDPVLCVKVLPIWDRVVTGDRSGCLKVWCATTGACLRTFRQHRMGVSSLVFQKNILISGSWDSTIIIWKQIQEAPYLKPQKIVDLGEQVSSMHLTERMELAFGTLSGRVKIISLKTVTSLGTFIGPAGTYCNAVSLSESRLEAAFGSQYISWDLATKAPIGFISDAHFDNINCMQVDESRKLIFTASQDSKVRIFSRDNKPMLLRQYGGHRASVRCLTIQNNMVITGSSDKTVIITFLEPHDHSNKDSILYSALSDSLETAKGSDYVHQHPDTESSLRAGKQVTSSLGAEMEEEEHLCVAEPVSLTHADTVSAVDADCSLLVTGSDDGTVRFFYFGDDLWHPPSSPSPRLCGQASLISLAAPRCVLMMKPGRTRVSVGNRRQTWGTCALAVLDRTRSLATNDTQPVIWMTVDEIYQKMVEWDMQPVR